MRSDFRTQRIVASTAISAARPEREQQGASHRARSTFLATTAVATAITLGLAGQGVLAQASDLYWDPQGSILPGQDPDDANGGDGTWSLGGGSGNADWDDAEIGGSNQAFSAGDNAFFVATAGTVTVANGGVTAGDITFETDGYLVDGDPITLQGAPGSFITVTNVNETATINSDIDGDTNSIDLTLDGAGNLVLGGAVTANTVTSFSGGTITISSTGSLETTNAFPAADDLDVSGGTLDNQGTITSDVTVAGGGELTSSGLITGDVVNVGASNLSGTGGAGVGGIDGDVTNTGVMTVTGPLQITGELENDSVFILDVDNDTQVGSLTVTSGLVTVTDSTLTVDTTADVTGTLSTSGTSAVQVGTSTAINTGGTVTIGGSGASDLGDVTNDGALEQTGSGTTTVGQLSNTANGTVTVSGGTLDVTGSISNTNTTSVWLDVSGGGTFATAATHFDGGSVTVDGGQIAVGGGGTWFQVGGTLSLAGVSDATGGTSTGATAAVDGSVLINGGTLDLTGDTEITGNFQQTGGTLDIDNDLYVGGGVTVFGSAMTVTDTNTLTSNATVQVVSSGSLDIDAGGEVDGAILASDGSVTNNGTITGNVTVGVTGTTSGSITSDGLIDGDLTLLEASTGNLQGTGATAGITGDLNIEDASTVTLDGALEVGGATNMSSSVAFDIDQDFTTDTLDITNASTVNVTTGTLTATSADADAINIAEGTLDTDTLVTGNITVGALGELQAEGTGGAGSGGIVGDVTATASGGSVVVTGDLDVTGSFDASGGTVEFSSAGTTLTAGGTITLGGFDNTTNGNVTLTSSSDLGTTIDGSVVIDGALVMDSGETLTINATNFTVGSNYDDTGNGGNLVLNVDQFTAQQDITVASVDYDLVADGATVTIDATPDATLSAGDHDLNAINGGTLTVNDEVTDIASVSIGDSSVLNANADMTIDTDGGGTGDLSTSGTGALIIADGVTVTAETINTAGTGGVEVGANASLVGGGNTINNDTTVNIAAGGDVTDLTGDINNDSVDGPPPSVGIYNLNGVGSTLEATAGSINNLNDGEININSAGTIVTAGTNLTLQDDSVFSVGATFGVTVSVGGTIEMSGNALLDNDGTFDATGETINVTGNAAIDNSSIMTAGTINNGGSLTNSGTLTAAVTNTGTGANGLTNTGTITGNVDNQGDADLENQINGTLTNTGAITLTGALDVAGTFTNNTSGSVDFGTNSATMTVDDAVVNANLTIQSGGGLTSEADVDVNGATLTNQGTLTATAGTGDLNIDATGVYNADGGQTNVNTLTVAGSGAVTNTGDFNVGGDVSNAGSITSSSGTFDAVSLTGTTGTSELINSGDSVMTFTGNANNNAGDITNSSSGNLTIAAGIANNTGDLLNSGSGDFITNNLNGNSGTITNSGSGDITNSGFMDGNSGIVTNSGSGNITASGAGGNSGTIINATTATGGMTFGDVLTNSGTITNAATTAGADMDLGAMNGNSGTIQNTGAADILGTTATGMQGTLTNSGAGNFTLTGAVDLDDDGIINQTGAGTFSALSVTNDGATSIVNVDNGTLTTGTFTNNNAGALVDVDGGVLAVTAGNFENTLGTVNIDTGEIDASAGSFVNSAGGDLVMTNGATLTTITLSTTGDVDVGSSTIDGDVAASGGTFDVTGGTVDVTGNFIASGSVDFDVAANATLDVADTGTFSFGSSTLGTAGTGSTIEAGTMLFTTSFTTDGTLEETGDDDTIAANGGTLTITANGQVASSVNIASGATVSNAGVIQEDVTVGAGATFISSNEVTGTVDNSGTATTLSGTVGDLNNLAGGTITLGGALDVTGTFDQQAGAGDVTFAGNTMTAGDVDLNANITVDAGGTLSSDTDVTLVGATATVNSDSTLTATGDLNLDGTSTVTNTGTTNAGTLTNTDGLVTSTGDFNVTNDVSNTGNINVNGGTFDAVNMNGNTGFFDVTADGAATFSGTLNNNSGTISIGIHAGTTTASLTAGDVDNNTGTIGIFNGEAGTVTLGAVTNNAGLMGNSGPGSFTMDSYEGDAGGQLLNSGAGTVVVVGTLTNNGGVVNQIGTGTTSAADIDNNTGTINVTAGELEASTLDNFDTVTSTGLLDIDTITNEGTLNAAGTGATAGIDGEVINQNGGVLNVTASLATTGDVTNTDGATIVMAGDLDVGGDFIQDDTGGDGGAVTFGGFELSAVNATINTDFTVDDGTLTATDTLSNESGETLTITATGVVNTVTGTIDGAIDNSGDFNATGDVTIAEVSTNQAGGTLDAANLTLADDFTNAGTVGADGNVGTVTNGATLTNASTGIINADSLVNNDTVDNSGAINAAVTNNGTFNSEAGSSIGGDFDNNVTFNVNGASTMTGAFTNDGDFLDGGAASLAITGTFTNNDNITLDQGGGFSTTGGTTSSGTITALGASGGVIGGNVSSSGTIDLASVSDQADNLEIGGNLSFGGGTLAFTGTGTGNTAVQEAITVGGSVSGNVNLTFEGVAFDTNFTNPTDFVLIDANSSGGALTFDDALITVNGATAYFAVYDPGSGDAYVLSDVSAGIGAVAGNIGLVQSLIGTIVNRPSSPFVSGLAYEDDDNCGTGSWARVTGGSATGTARTNNGVSNLPSTVEADYAGLTMGIDYGCFDVSDSPFDIAGGMILGYNQGSTSQKVFNIDYSSGTPTPTSLLSTTETDFTQTYVGAYLAFAKDAYTADVQLRSEQTKFTFNNPVLVLDADGITPAAGFFDEEVDSKSTTLSASISYSYPLSDSLTLVPTGGFGITRSSTDDVILRDPGDETTEVGRMVFEDHTTSIGFVGATLARTVIGEAGDSAWNQFVTATYYKDFSDPLEATYVTDTAQLPISTEPLGDFGELSVGLSYIKILDGQVGNAKQLNASARIDGRFSEDVEALSLTAQIRLQF